MHRGRVFTAELFDEAPAGTDQRPMRNLTSLGRETLRHRRLALVPPMLFALVTPLTLKASLPAAHGRVAPESRPISDPRRVVAVVGGQNFRDLGGYRTIDGRMVKWRMIYRSGAMDKLTAADFTVLERRQIRDVFDLRSTGERRQARVGWPVGYTPRVHAIDYKLNLGGIMPKITDPTLSEAAAIDLGRAFYAELPYQLAEQYRDLIQTLLLRGGPVVFNCAAGKDRTGVAAALLLTALGVPRATVIADYLLSNQLFDAATLATDVKVGAAARAKAAGSPMIRVLMTVDVRLLDAAFAGIDARSGSLTAYLRDELGIGPAELARLRGLYLA